MTTPTQLFTLLDACFDAQNEATALWHSQEPEAADVAPDASASPETLLALVRAQHLRNFRLWHIEDTARRRDVTPDVIADCKYRIDRLNQERNDRIERVDACLVALLSPLLPEEVLAAALLSAAFLRSIPLSSIAFIISLDVIDVFSV